MWKRVKNNLELGIEKIKWFSALLNERVKVEISLMGLLYQSAEMEKKKAELMRAIGERIFELRNSSEKNILRDPVILGVLNKLEGLDAELEEAKNKASELGRTGP